MERRLFAIDHNFPEPLITSLADILPADFVPVRKIDPSFSDLPDSWDGLVTNDDAMLSLAKEMTVLQQTQLSLVIAKGVALSHEPHLRNRTGMDAGARRRVMRSARRGEYEASVAS